LINNISAGKINFEKLVSTPKMMTKLGKLGKILGPKD
jgi:ribosomal protein L1